MRRARRVLITIAVAAFLLAGACLVREWFALGRVVEEKFHRRPWALPSRVYSAPLVVYAGLDLKEIGFFERLARLGYRRVAAPVRFRGDYRLDPSGLWLDIVLHEFSYPTHAEVGRRLRLFLDGRLLRGIRDLATGEEVFTLEIEPEIVTSIHGETWEERGVVGLGEVPPTLIAAVIAAEDSRFFQHHGIDWLAVARATWRNLAAGRIVQGGSTLTQQLMKNFYLTRERTIGRKLREAAMALFAELKYSKQEILENYLNEIYLGQNGAQGIFGVAEAARFYFGKKLADLTLGEAALIGGLIRAPNLYSPFRDPSRALARRNFVLRRMVEEELASAEEAAVAEDEPLVLRDAPAGTNDAPYFVDLVRRELEERFGGKTLAEEGLRLFTTLDPRLQRAAEEAVKEGLAELERDYPVLRRESPEQRLQACLVALRPATGEIVALVGGRDYRISQFDRVTQSRRQPGSVFKPIIYLAALEEVQGGPHLLPTSRVRDEPFSWHYDGKEWRPANYGEHYWGEVTLRRALQMSLNAATARIARQVGIQRVVETAHRLGINTPLPSYPSIVLGSVELAPLEVASAYSVLAAGGVLAPPRGLTAVVSADGTVLEGHPLTIHNVVSPQVAYLVTNLLSGVLDHGTGRGVRERGFMRPAAGKTGTTNDYNDAWFAGYTPDLAAVVWVGFDHHDHLGLTGAQAALPIWTAFMLRATRGTPPARFQKPPGVTTVRIDPESGALATPRCPSVIEEAFLAGDEPKEPCPLHGERLWERVPAEVPSPPPKRRERAKAKPWWFIF